MSKNFKVKLSRLIKEVNLESLYLPCPAEEILVECNEVNRPGLQFSGFYDFYDNNRIQILGKSEFAYLKGFDQQKKQDVLEAFFSTRPKAVIISMGIVPCEFMMELTKKYQVPLLKSQETTSSLMSLLISTLNIELAPRVTRHGVFVEVYGEGILLLGESGVGKSETAIELIKRGHRLIADDAVELRRTSAKTIIGTSPENIRHYIELRGIGIVNVRRLFGMGSVKVSERVDMVINLEQWDKNKVYDRMGIDTHYTDLLGVQIPCLTIPVKPGRNLAIIIEVAAVNNRQKSMGYNAAKELLEKLEKEENNIETVGSFDWSKLL